MLYRDLEDVVSHYPNNCYSVMLFQLLLKADATNFKKLDSVYPIEARMVYIYKNECIYSDSNKTTVDFRAIEKKAKEWAGREVN